MKHTLINAPSLEGGKVHAKGLFKELRWVESYREALEADLFDADSAVLFALSKHPNSLEINELKSSSRPLVLILEKLPASHALFTWLKKEGEVIDLCQEAPWQRQKRLESLIKKACLSIEPAALQALLSLKEEELEKELDKLATYNPHITLAAVDALVLRTKEATVWNFLDALLRKEAGAALSLSLGSLDAYFGVIKLVRAQQRNLLLFKEAPAGEKRSALAHVKERGFQSLSAAASKFTKQELEESLIRLDKLDFMMRDGLNSEELIHTLLVAYTC